MNTEDQSFARKACVLGLLRIAEEGRPFPGRNGAAESKALIDVRGAASNIALRTLLLAALARRLCDYSAETIGGVSRGGLVLGSQLSLFAGLPFVAVLPEGPRTSGAQRAVEGDVAGKKVVLFDNVVTTGGSLRNAALRVFEAGGTTAGALVVGAYDTLPALPFPIHSVFSFPDLVRAAHEIGLINNARRDQILKS